jgi:hypothetical protein
MLAINSMQEHCDETRFSRGRWKEYPWETKLSSDLVWETQMDHRNYMINQIPEGDYFIPWDSDQIMLGRSAEIFKTIREGIWDVIFINCCSDGKNWVKRPKIFRKTEGMKYKINHFSLFHKNSEKPLPYKYKEQVDHFVPLELLDLSWLRTAHEKARKEKWKEVRNENMNYREAFRR